SEAGCRVPAGEGRIEKPGMGFTFAEFDGGRRAVFHGGGFAEMGWGALHRATADESELGEDVDGREVEQWEAEQSELRVRLGNRQREWASGDRFPRRTRNSLRSEEHTSELQSRGHLVCRLLLEKKKKKEHKTSQM